METTKKHYNDSQSLSGVELKEFSLIYLVLNNLKLIQENIHLIENVKLFTEINKQIFNEILLKLRSKENLSIDQIDIDIQLIEKFFKTLQSMFIEVFHPILITTRAYKKIK